MRIMRGVLPGLIMIGALAGCSLFTAGQAAAPPPPEEALEYVPPTPTPEPTPTETPIPFGVAGVGEVIFVRGGQVRAVGVDGSNERPLTQLPEGATPRDLALSPTGRYLALSVDSQEALVLDLSEGVTTTIDQITAGRLSDFLWGLDGTTLYYHRLVFDEATSLPTASQIWQVTLPLQGDAERVFEVLLDDGTAVFPRFALTTESLIVEQLAEEGETPFNRWMILDLAGGELRPLVDGYGVFDLSPDRRKILLFNNADLPDVPGQQALSLPLYMADLDPAGTVSNITQVSPEGEGVIYAAARFAPDGLRIVALQRAPSADGTLRSRVVLLQPDPEGIYQVTPLGVDEAMDDLGFAWHGEDGVIVQRMPVEGGDSTLWLVPLSGAPGIEITTGETPLVVGVR